MKTKYLKFLEIALKAQRRVEALGITNLFVKANEENIIVTNKTMSKFWSTFNIENITVDLIVEKTLEMSLQKSKIKYLNSDLCNKKLYSDDEIVTVDYIGKDFIVDRNGNKHNIDKLYIYEE